MKRSLASLWATACIVVTVWAHPSASQTLSNPDISVVSDTRLNFRTQETADALGTQKVEFEQKAIELNFNAYLNPYMRADVFIGLHGVEGPVELEQASMTVLRGLPLATQFAFGRNLLDFGKLNTQHPHQFAWLQFPLMHRTMLSEEGARVVGANVSTLQSIGETAVTLSLNAFSGDLFGREHGEGEHSQVNETEEAEQPAEIMYSGRLSLFRSLTDFLSLETGGSYMYGEYDPNEALTLNLLGVDMKAKWRPDAYRAVIWTVEAMYSDREVEHEGGAGPDSVEIEDVTAFGAFSAVEVRFRKRFDVGGFFDFTEDATTTGAETTGAGVWVAFMPVEETARFSLVYRYETSDLYDATHHSVTFQVVWALGPHQPHPF